MSEQTVGQRISQLIAYLGISKNAFAASLDKTATVIQHLVDERNKPGFDLLCKIFEVYPNVSKTWLMQGKGTMLADAEPTAPEPKEVASAPSQEKPVAVAKPEAANTNAASAPAEPVTAPPIEKVVPPAVSVPAPEAPAPSVAAPPAPSIAPSVAAVPAFATATLPLAPTPAPAAPPAPTVDPTASLQAALYAQQLTHQLALAEMRNQHLQEQQRMMQQMMEMMQRQLSR